MAENVGLCLYCDLEIRMMCKPVICGALIGLVLEICM